VLLRRLVGVPMPMPPRKILIWPGALTVQHMMSLAMAFVSFINLLYYEDVHNEIGAKCFLVAHSATYDVFGSGFYVIYLFVVLKRFTQ
jgi:hypothetical protein